MIAEKIGLEVLKKSLPSIQKKLGILTEELEHYSENKLIPYIVDSYNALNVSTSQLFRNKGYKIDQLYIPLSLLDSEKKSYKIDEYPNELLKSYSKILINDSAGMGKSTILKMLFRFSVDNGKQIPFYIDLKSLIRDEEVLSIEDYILDSFPSFSNKPSKDFLLTLLSEIPFLFLFDGADEVPDKFKTLVFKAVLKFCSNAKQCNFVVATRDEDKILSSFNSFNSFSINPLLTEEAYELLHKYQFKDVKASDLIAELEKKENIPVLEFLKNPLLTTLLYTAYAYKKKVPLKKNLFFSQIFEALYENHDATKIGYLTREKKSGLDIDDFEKILSHLAYVSRMEEKLEYSKSELLELVSKISQYHPTITFNIRGFVDDLISCVPVLRRDGIILSWQHKSIQEYLFVRFLFLMLKDDKREKVLNKIISGNSVGRYKLVLDIIYDENEELFHNVITRKVLKHSLMNRKKQHINKDKISNSLNSFYRYISGPLKSLVSKEEHDRYMSTTGSNSRLKIIRDEVEKRYNLNHFYMLHCRFQTDISKTNCTLIYISPITVCLYVLLEKSAMFISKYQASDDYNYRSQELIENINHLGDINEFKELGIQTDILYLDTDKCQAFMNELDIKLKKREEDLELLDY